MILIKGLKKENIEALATLWDTKEFQKLVEILRLTQENYGQRMLKGRIDKDNFQIYREYQDTATAFSVVIKLVEDAYLKANNKRRKKHANK